VFVPAADKRLSASLDLSLSKGEATAAAAQATAAAPSSGVAVLSVPQVSVDLSIKKKQVPLLTVSDAPCKKICKDKCTITLEKQCLTVDVPKKHCDIEKKTITKQFCEKKCKPSLSLALPEFKLPTLPQADNANPSTPPAAVNPSAPPATLQAAAEGRRLQGLPKADLDLQCHDVCVDVPFVLPELKCTETTEKVEKCTKVPNKECKEECICLPQKSLSFAVLKKPALSLSVDASDSSMSVDASASSQRALKELKIVLPTKVAELAKKKWASFSVPKLPSKPLATLDLQKKTFAVAKP
jgi:hypothetical protein